MKLITKVLSEVNELDWDNQLKRKNHSTTFQVACYNKPPQLMRNCKPIYLRLSDGGGNIVGQLSVLIDINDPRQKMNRFSKILVNKLNLGTRIIWDYGPIIFDYNNQKKILESILTKLDQLADQYNIETIRGSSNPLNVECGVDVFKNFGYDCKLWSTYIINCNQKPNEFYDSLDKKIKYDLRKAEQNDLVFEVANKREQMDELARLRSKLLGRISPEAYTEYERDYTWNVLYKSELRKIFLVKHKDELIGGINALIFNENIVQTSVTNTRNELKGGIFLTWNAIKWSLKNKIKTFNLGGANPNPISQKEKGIDFYKSKWKGKKYHNFIFLKIRKPRKRKISSVVMHPNIITSKIKNILKNE